MPSRFEDKVVVITGASSGIGRALAARFTAEGAHVVGGGRHQGRLAELGEAIELAMTLDVTRDSSVQAFADAALDRYGRVDVLVNNAGVGLFSPWDETPLDDFRRLFEVNVLGAVRLTQALLPSMVARGEGVLVNVASVAGLRAYDKLSAYSASKFAMIGWSEVLRSELARSGVGVVVACPPQVDTPFFDNAGFPTYREQPGHKKLMSAEECAQRLVDAVARRDRLALIGPRARLLYSVHKLAPGLLPRLRRAVRG